MADVPETQDDAPAVHTDARERSVRSLLQGLALDVAVAAVLVLLTAFSSIEWTREYWVLLGLTLAKSLLQAVVSYFARILVVPKSARATSKR